MRIMRPGPWDTIQGEGLYAGVPSTFLRLAGCNLRCSWCDTPASLPDYDTVERRFRLNVTSKAQESKLYELSANIHVRSMKHLVITGGEPMLQYDDVADLCGLLPNHHVTIETNGSVPMKNAMLDQHRTLLSFSPKVWQMGYEDSDETTQSIRTWAEAGYKYQIKIVLSKEDKIQACEELISRFTDSSHPPVWAAIQLEASWLRFGVPKETKRKLIDLCRVLGVRLVAQMHPVLKVP